MARPERYFIGPNVRDALRDTILRVGGTALSGGDGRVPTRLQDIPRPAGGGTQVIKAYFWGAWNKGTIKELSLTRNFEAETTIRAFNGLKSIMYLDETTGRMCFLIPENDADGTYEYILLNAEC